MKLTFYTKGIGKNEQEVGKPSLLKKLAARNIAQIACGGNHCLALTKSRFIMSFLCSQT